MIKNQQHYHQSHDGLNILTSLIIIGSLIFLWFQIFTIKATIAIVLIIVAIFIKAFLKWASIKEQGFLNRVSSKLRKVLLERSLFDILCDIWYFQAIKRHLRAFLAPFILKRSPEELIESLDDINPAIKQIVLRKGVINILPESLKQSLTLNYNPTVEDAQLENANQLVLSQGWDRFGDYCEFEEQKKRRHKQKAKTLFTLMSVLLQKPIVDQDNYKLNLNKLSSTCKKTLLISLIVVAGQVYFIKSSRKFYYKAFVSMSAMSLLTLTAVSAGLLVAASKKQKNI